MAISAMSAHSSPKIRVLPADYPAACIQAFMGQTSMTAATPLVIARCGDHPYGHFMGVSQALGAFEGERLVGYVRGVVAPTQLLVGGELVTESALYFGDLRIDDRQRRRGLAVALLDRLAEFARERGALRGYCYVNEGNDAMLRLLQAGKCRLQGKSVSQFETASRLLPLKPLSTWRGHYQQRPLSELQLGPLLQRRGEGIFSTVMTEDWLRSVGSVAGEQLRCFAALDAPDTLAFALWDQFDIRQLRLQTLDRSSAITLKVWRVLSGINGGLAPPRRGEGFRMAELCWVADDRIAQHPAAAIAAAWEMGVHILNLPVVGQPPTGPLWQSLRTHVVAFAIDGQGLPETHPALPIIHDLGWI